MSWLGRGIVEHRILITLLVGIVAIPGATSLSLGVTEQGAPEGVLPPGWDRCAGEAPDASLCASANQDGGAACKAAGLVIRGAASQTIAPSASSATFANPQEGATNWVVGQAAYGIDVRGIFSSCATTTPPPEACGEAGVDRLTISGVLTLRNVVFSKGERYATQGTCSTGATTTVAAGSLSGVGPIAGPNLPNQVRFFPGGFVVMNEFAFSGDDVCRHSNGAAARIVLDVGTEIILGWVSHEVCRATPTIS